MLPESRLRSLYSDFRELKLVNIDGYEANIRQWKEYLIKEYWQNSVIINGDDIISDLTIPQYGAPKSIDVVLDEMVKDGTIVPMERYLKRNESVLISMLKWTINKVVVDLSWKSRSNEGTRYLKPVKYVNIFWLKHNSETIQKLLQENIYECSIKPTDYIFTKEHFYKKSGIDTIVKDWDSYNIILDYLCDQNNIVMASDDESDVIKVISPLSLNITGNSQEIADSDIYVAKINHYVFIAESEITSAQKVVELTGKRLSNAISSGLSLEIKRTLLRLKKRAEKNLEQAYISLESLKKLQEEISNATQTVSMVKIMSQGSSALKSINKQLIDEESIADMLDEFQENNEKQERISKLLAGESITDETAIEKELSSLEKELRKDESQKPKIQETQHDSPSLEESEKHSSSTEDLIKRLETLKVSSGDIIEAKGRKEKEEEEDTEMKQPEIA
ncbi:hypothetical protein C6P41_000578 [Kluyveromyces marxianus]|nr:hypothetical protein C6P43_000049 [Kluyveromyces marxianus]KAG0685200.1 hypothetical protein C6P41_000578 [Kluyveromyces marxianus]